MQKNLVPAERELHAQTKKNSIKVHIKLKLYKFSQLHKGIRWEAHTITKSERSGLLYYNYIHFISAPSDANLIAVSLQ
jgi:hypothetical protein